MEGKQLSVAVLDTKLLATTGRFFFSDGSSLEPSAGLFTPPTEDSKTSLVSKSWGEKKYLSLYIKKKYIRKKLRIKEDELLKCSC